MAWQDVRAGDILQLNNNEFVAADMLVLSSSEEDGLCYIDTSSMDGSSHLIVVVVAVVFVCMVSPC